LAASRALETRGRYGLLQLEYKISEGPGVLTEVWSGRGVTQRHRRRDPAAGRGRSFAVRALQGSSEHLDPSAWLAVLLHRYNGGQGGTGLAGGEKSSGGRTHPGGSRVKIPALAGLRSGEIELGEAPGPEAERRLWLSVAEVLRNGRTTAAQGGLLGGATRRRRLGCGGGCEGEIRFPGGCWVV
jgi:hypothetical protein